MLYTLSVECVSGAYLREPCLRVLEVCEDCTLEELHRAIQKAVSFDSDHLYDFYAGRHYRDRKVRYTETELWEDREAAFSEVRLCDLYPLDRLKLYYWFDFGDNWIFEIRKARTVKEAVPGVVYPVVVERRGPDPKQYPSWE